MDRMRRDIEGASLRMIARPAGAAPRKRWRLHYAAKSHIRSMGSQTQL